MIRKLKRGIQRAKVAAVTAGVALAAGASQAAVQKTDSLPDATGITSSVESAFIDASTLGIGIVTIGIVIWAIRRGVKARG